jgi:hypothetical protein
MGVKEPITDWTVDRETICALCAKLNIATLPPGLMETPKKAVDTAIDHDTLPPEDSQPVE